jgi:hypothetical protein
MLGTDPIDGAISHVADQNLIWAPPRGAKTGFVLSSSAGCQLSVWPPRNPYKYSKPARLPTGRKTPPGSPPNPE